MQNCVVQARGLAPLEARAEPLQEDGDDADDESRPVQACLHLVTSLSVPPPSGGSDKGLIGRWFRAVERLDICWSRGFRPRADASCACCSASSSCSSS